MKKDFQLLPGEELHQLIEDKLYILQKQDQFRFGIDSVLLANWVKVRRRDKVVDLGTGSGIITLLLAFKQNPKEILGIEIQEQMAALAKRSVILNELEAQVDILHYDLRLIKEVKLPNCFSLAISNPPYFPKGSGAINPTDAKAIARHEIYCTIKDLVDAAAFLVGTGGKFAMIHRAERIPEIFQRLMEKRFEIKRMRLIQPRINQEPNLVLIESIKDGKPGLKIEPNLVIYDENGNYTDDVQKMYSYDGG